MLRMVLTTGAFMNDKQLKELREWIKTNDSWLHTERKLIIPLGNYYIDFQLEMVG